MANNQKITVLMPVYNAAEFIGLAIQSVLEQTHENFELLIVNDGSDDATVNVIQSFSDPRITLINQARNGVAAALNAGLSIAKADYIARFDADDICMPARLQKQINFLVDHPEYVAVGSDAEYITVEGNHLFDFKCIAQTHQAISEKIYFYCPFIHSSVMYKRGPVIDAGGYFGDAHHFEDYLLWVRLIAYGKFYNIPEQLIKVRFHSSSVTIDEKWRSRRFRKLKRNSILKGAITKKEGDELLEIIRKQENQKIKEGSYYALCGKKYLLNNHQPYEARVYLNKAIRIHPARLDNYLLLLLSYFPKRIINWLHQKSPNKI